MPGVSEPVDERIQEAAEHFLRGDTSVLDFTSAFRSAMDQFTQDRPLHGQELDLFYALEEWESAAWAKRPELVDRLRTLAQGITGRRA